MTHAWAKAQFVEHTAPQAEWRLVHRVADAVFPALLRAILQALRLAPREEDLERLAIALRDEVAPRLFRTYLRVAEVVARHVQRHGVIRKERARRRAVGFRFDQTNPLALEWAERASAKLVVEISTATQEGIRAVIAQGFSEGIAPLQLSKRLRQMVGLTQAQVKAVARYREDLAFGGQLTKEVIDRRVQAYAAKKLRERTMNIARTETLSASNAGQVDAWRAARRDGWVDQDLVKEFIVTPDDALCVVCAPLAGEQVAIDAAFSFGQMQPPVHPQCRCAVGLVAPRQVA